MEVRHESSTFQVLDTRPAWWSGWENVTVGESPTPDGVGVSGLARAGGKGTFAQWTRMRWGFPGAGLPWSLGTFFSHAMRDMESMAAPQAEARVLLGRTSDYALGCSRFSMEAS